MSTRKTRRISIIAGVAVAAAIALISGGIVAASGDPTPTLENLSKPTPTWVETTPVPETPPTTAVTTPGPVSTTPTKPATSTGSTRVFTLTAGSNDGLIHLTKYACGTSKNWQAVAADNKILGPEYWVITGQTVKVNCDSVTKPLPAAKPAAAPPQPAVAPKAAPAPVTASWVSPLVGKCYTSSFGWRNGKIHNGLDFPTAVGTDVRAVAAGTVHWGNDPGGAGWYIALDHGNGVWTMYYHLSSRLIGDGVHVKAGTHIAESGGRPGAAGAGNSTGPHLHFETHPWGEWTRHYSSSLGANAYANPVSFMSARGVNFSRC